MSDQHGPGHDQGWKAYERPDAPEPEPTPEAVPASATGSDWSVYGASYDPPGPQPGASPPPAPYAPLPRRFQARPSGGWRGMSTGKRFKVAGGVVVVVIYVFGQLLGLVTGDSESASDSGWEPSGVMVAPDSALRNALSVRALRQLRQAVRDAHGHTDLTHLSVLDTSAWMDVAVGDEEISYEWTGGPLTGGDTYVSSEPVYDLADVDLAAIVRAGEQAQEMAGHPDNWWVAVYVPHGETEPVIQAQAFRDTDGGARVELSADGEVRRSETW